MPAAAIQLEDGSIKFTGRTLFLTEDASLIRQQLAGNDLTLTPEIALRSDISTDEIIPVYRMYHFDDKLGDHAYEGLRCEQEYPVATGSIRNGGFSVSVSGQRRGKGSSREHAPLAEYHAGIRMIIAESFERIYRENCHNLGIITSTDFDLIRCIQAGESIPFAQLVSGLDQLSIQILRQNGLFSYVLWDHQSQHIEIPAARKRPQTLGEKILARHRATQSSSNDDQRCLMPGDHGLMNVDLRISHDYITGMAAALLSAQLGDHYSIRDPQSLLLFRDHLPFLDEVITPGRKTLGLLDAAHALNRAQQDFASRHGIKLHGEQADRKGAEGINHNLVLEKYALPGDLVVSADSHAPHMGAIGCLAIAVGSTALATSWLTREIHLVVPESARIRLVGEVPPGITAKDIMLHLLQLPVIKSGGLVGKLIEYDGDVVDQLCIDERATLTNMATEIGAFSALVAPDQNTITFLQQRGMHLSEAESVCHDLSPDATAIYADDLLVDVSCLKPMIALPGDPGNGIPFDELGSDVAIDIAFSGSCTGSKSADMDMVAAVFADAMAAGQTVHPRVKCYIQAGSIAVRNHCEQSGYLDLFEKVGARFLEPGCGACCNAGPGVSDRPDQVTVSSINRNFPGRSGPGRLYLASPYTVAASAIAGRLAVYQGRIKSDCRLITSSMPR